ncbi:hypothetical protein ECOT7509_0312 [Escherichia coli TW07509]|nr:hypothetical protein ECOT7509_0312 [Escherichia coli TW07509]
MFQDNENQISEKCHHRLWGCGRSQLTMFLDKLDWRQPKTEVYWQ